MATVDANFDTASSAYFPLRHSLLRSAPSHETPPETPCTPPPACRRRCRRARAAARRPWESRRARRRRRSGRRVCTCVDAVDRDVAGAGDVAALPGAHHAATSTGGSSASSRRCESPAGIFLEQQHGGDRNDREPVAATIARSRGHRNAAGAAGAESVDPNSSRPADLGPPAGPPSPLAWQGRNPIIRGWFRLAALARAGAGRAAAATASEATAAGVAQLVEHDVANVVVVGSNPITRSLRIAVGESAMRATILARDLSPRRRADLLSRSEARRALLTVSRNAIGRRMSAKDLDEPEVDELKPKTPTRRRRSEAAAERLNLDVKIDSPSACERHVTVTVSREDVDRYLDEAYSELMATAAVPGFRVGRAPRKLVENRFKDEIGEKIKGSLLMDSLTQISEEQSFTAISEPELNLDAIEVPDEGPMVFEFDIEVRPEFDLPKWKGLQDRAARCASSPTPTSTSSSSRCSPATASWCRTKAPPTAGDYVTANIRVDARRQAARPAKKSACCGFGRR